MLELQNTDETTLVSDSAQGESLLSSRGRIPSNANIEHDVGDEFSQRKVKPIQDDERDESDRRRRRRGGGGGGGEEEGAEGLGELKCLHNEDRFRLIERAFDEIGAGWFHVVLFLTASLGFFVEAAEMSLWGLLSVEFEKEWGVEEEELSIIPSATGVGMVLGTALFSRLSDEIGRKPVYHASLGICVVVGFLCSYAKNVQSFALMRLLLGFGYAGNTVSSATLLMESVPTAWRGFFSAMTSYSFTLGGLWVVLLSWALMDSWGWQWVVRLVAIVGLPAFVALSFIPGSCRFAVMKKDYRKAVDIMEKIARMNGVPCPAYFTVDILTGPHGNDLIPPEQLIAHTHGYFGWLRVFRGRNGQTLFPLMSIWFLNSFGLALVQFFPLELEKRYNTVDNAQYKIAFGMSLGGICGSLLVTYLASRVNRKTELRSGLLIIGTCVLFVSQFTGGFPIAFGTILVNQIGMSLIFHGLYTYTPEVFPTALRVTSFGICQLSHRLAPVISPYLLSHLIEDYSFRLAGFLYSIVFFVGFGITFRLKRETFGKAMVEEDDSDAEEDEGDVAGGEGRDQTKESAAIAHKRDSGLNYGSSLSTKGGYTVVDLAPPVTANEEAVSLR